MLHCHNSICTFFARDRENCTVFVSDLPPGATEQELAQLFKDVNPFLACPIHRANTGANSAAL